MLVVLTCHADKPPICCILVKIAAASRPEMTLDMTFPACQIAIRRGDSSLVYQELVIKDTAGMKGPSVSPTRNRHRMNDQPLFIAVMQIVTVDQANMKKGIRTLGFPLARIMLAGIY